MSEFYTGLRANSARFIASNTLIRPDVLRLVAVFALAFSMFIGASVEAKADTTGPRAVSAETSRDGSQVTITFDEAIRSDPAPDQGVFLTVDNAWASLGSGAYVVEGQAVTVTPRTPVTVGQTIRAMVFGSGGGERIRDLSGNVVQTTTNLPVTNGVVDIRATLLLTPDEIVENGGESVVTATLNEVSTGDTTVTVSVTPEAGAAAGDVTLSANRVLTIAAGATTSTGTVTLTANDNNVAASAKTFTVSGTVANADEDVAAPDDVPLTIDDDDSGGICSRTRQVREAILARLDGVTRCADVTDAHLAGITDTLELKARNISSLRAGDFAGLSSVRILSLYGNALITLPSGVLTGLSDLTALYLDDNALTALPADLLTAVPELDEIWARNNALTAFPRGFFAGKREVGDIQVYHNPGDPDLRALDPVASHRGDPLGVYYGLEALGQGRFKIVVPVGTAFETAVSLGVTNGTLDSDRVVMPAGRLESGVLTVTRTPGTSAPVTVDIVDLRSTDLDKRPGDYSRKLTSMLHNGIVPAKSGNLPLEVLAATPPALASAVVNGDVLTLTYEEALDEESVPAASAYSVSVGGTAQTPGAVTVSGRAVTVTLSSRAYVGQEVTVSYTAPASNPVRSAAGTGADNLTDYVVTNETPNTAPTIETAAALDAAEHERTVVTLAATDPDPDATRTWSLTGGADRSHFTLSENVLEFTAEKDFERPDDTGSDGGYEVTVTVVDDRGAEASKALTVTLTDETEVTTAADGSVATDEDTPYRFAADDFNFAGTDADDALASVTIVTGPSAGSLELDGTAVTADQVVTTAQLDNGDLVFTPAANAHGSGYATFTFKVSDGETASADAYTMTVDVTAVNDAATGAPTISGTTMVGQTLTASTAGIADADGLTGVSYSYQWIRVDSGNGGNPRNIAGATSSRYTLTRDDQYENVMVRVSFTDDDHNDEALTSDISVRVRASLSSIPASADVLVSNLRQLQDGVRGRFGHIDVAQRFTTGGNAGGYTLRSVDLLIYTDNHSGTIPPRVKIFSGSADGAEAATLRGPAALEANIEKTYAFTASGTVTLNPSTDYWVVAEGGAANLLGTASDSEDAASASGWSIRDVSEYRDASSTDSFQDAASNAARIRINGAARGLVFSRTQVTVDEGGTAGYTVQLDAPPSASVTVSLASGDADAATVSPASLTFTTSDWNTAQEVTVTGVEDDDGDHESVTLTHRAAGFAPRTVTAAVNDDDDDVAPAAASATVTGASLVITFDQDLAAAPDLANGAFTVQKKPSGGAEQTETLTGSPLIDGRTVTLTLGSAAVSTDIGVTVSYTKPATGSGNRLVDGNGNEVAAFTRNVTNDTPNCPAGQPADAFATACLTVAEVNEGYGYSLTGGAISSASGAKTWNFTHNDKSYVIAEIKTVQSGLTKEGLNVVFRGNPPPASESWILQVGSRSFRFDARTRYVFRPSTGIHNPPKHTYIWASPGFTWDAGNYGDRVSVSLRSDARELTFSPSAVEVDEGGTATYSVKLDAQPSKSVTVDVVSGDEDAATVSEASLTFTTSDWNTAQEVTVTGVEDDDGNHESVTLTHSGAGVGTATVAVRVNDDDAAAQTPTAPGYTAPASLQVGTALTPMNPTDGAGIDSYSAGGLPAGLSIDTGTGVISGTPDTANADTASVTVTVSDTADNTDTVDIVFPAVAKGDQDLSGFAYSSDTVTFGNAAPTLTAPTVQDGATLSYAGSDETVCTVDGASGALTLVDAGACTVTVTAAATDNYNAGTQDYTVTVNPAGALALTLDAITGDNTINIAEKAAGFDITGATGTVAGADVSVVISSEDPLTATTGADGDWSVAVDADAAYLTGAGVKVTVSASKAGLTDATNVEQTLAIDLTAPGKPEYSAPAGLTVGTAISTISPVGGSGIDSYRAAGLPPGLAIDTGTGAISGTPDTANADTASVTVTVSDTAGNTDTVDIAFPEVARGDQALNGFAYSSASVTFGSAAPTVTAPSGVQTTLSYSAGPATVCTVDASTGALTIVGAGSCEITATAAGNDDYNAATATYTVTVQPAGTLALNISTISGDDTINTAEKETGFMIGGDTGSEGGVSVTVSVGSTELTATSADADPAAWSVRVPADASYITGTSVDVKVTASKTGFTSPGAVTRTLAVDLTAPTAPGYTAPASLQVGAALTPMNPSDGAGIDSYSAGGLPAGLSIDTGTGVISGTPDTANADTASVTVTVSDTAGNTDTVDITFPAVAKGDQDLSGFAYSSASVTFGAAAPTVTAPTGAHTALSYSAGPAAVCTVDASTGALTIVGAGSCQVTATAAGSDDYNAATATYTVTSDPVLGAPTNLRAAGGDEQVSLTWSAPQYDGRITGYEFRFCRVVTPSDCSGERATASAEAGAWTSTDSANAHTVMYWYSDKNGQMIRFRLVNGNRYRFQVRAVAGEVVGEATAWLEGIPSAPPPPPAVLTEFVLVDVSDQSSVTTLSDAAAVDLGARVGGSFGVRARVAPGADIGSVVLSLSGAKTVSRTENIAPYSLYGDANTGTGSALYGEDLPAGSYTLSATAYAARRASGAVLDTLTVSFRVLSAPALSVADASAEEGTDATLDFAVTLDKAANVTVTVDYATSDGTATAGQDYTATSGKLTFATGTREQTVSVPVLNDDHDDGGETLTLRLTNAAGATIGDATATGTIENSDPLPKAWLSRFGRTGALHVVGILDARFEAAAHADNHLTLGGRAVNLAAFRQTVTGRPTEPTAPEHAEPPATGNADAADPATAATCAECDGNRVTAAVATETRGQGNITPDRADGSPLQDVTPTPPVPAAGYEQESYPATPEQARDASLLESALWQALTNPVSLRVDRNFLSQSGFQLSLTDLLRPDEPDTDAIETVQAAPDQPGHWSLWGQGAMTQFQGTENGINLDGEVLTGLLGLDYAKARWLAGVALAYHDGDGAYRAPGGGTGGDLNSALLTVNPYLRYALTERLSVWGTLGYGAGTLQLHPGREAAKKRGQGNVTPDHATGPDDDNVTLIPSIPGMGELIETDLRMSMGAVGLRGVVYAGAGTELALKSDALWVRTASGETQGLQAVDAADTSRIRLLLSGRHQRALPNDALLSPSFELGIRYDGGDAETGFGMELGGGLRYADSVLGLTVETRARALIAHEDSGYREWGLGGSITLDPGRLGRGLALRLDSGWGIADSGAEALWQRQSAAGLAPQQGPATRGRLSAELGYGLDVPWTYGILTPYSGMEWGGGSRTLRLGWRFNLGQQLSLSLDGERRETAWAAPEHGLMLRTTLPW